MSPKLVQELLAAYLVERRYSITKCNNPHCLLPRSLYHKNQQVREARLPLREDMP